MSAENIFRNKLLMNPIPRKGLRSAKAHWVQGKTTQPHMTLIIAET